LAESVSGIIMLCRGETYSVRPEVVEVDFGRMLCLELGRCS